MIPSYSARIPPSHVGTPDNLDAEQNITSLLTYTHYGPRSVYSQMPEFPSDSLQGPPLIIPMQVPSISEIIFSNLLIGFTNCFTAMRLSTFSAFTPTPTQHPNYSHHVVVKSQLPNTPETPFRHSNSANCISQLFHTNNHTTHVCVQLPEHQNTLSSVLPPQVPSQHQIPLHTRPEVLTRLHVSTRVLVHCVPAGDT